MSDDTKPTATQYGHGILIGIHESDLLDVLAVLDAGIRAKKMNLAYYLEREQVTAAELVDEQIGTATALYDVLEPLLQLPTEEETQKIIQRIMQEE